MDHSDHVNLLRPANLPFGGTWADFGAGTGAFTLALRELVGPHANIYAVDKDQRGCRELEKAHRE
jgi:precorrin-6B methylase 2